MLINHKLLMSDQNGGQNEIYNAENNGSVQVSKKDGAVEDTISEDLQELQGENNRRSWLDIVTNNKIDQEWVINARDEKLMKHESLEKAETAELKAIMNVVVK
ncbi:hypothetical protein V6N13_036619 [Hibiscus sabdariffa]